MRIKFITISLPQPPKCRSYRRVSLLPWGEECFCGLYCELSYCFSMIHTILLQECSEMNIMIWTWGFDLWIFNKLVNGAGCFAEGVSSTLFDSKNLSNSNQNLKNLPFAEMVPQLPSTFLMSMISINTIFKKHMRKCVSIWRCPGLFVDKTQPELSGKRNLNLEMPPSDWPVGRKSLGAFPWLIIDLGEPSLL